LIAKLSLKNNTIPLASMTVSTSQEGNGTASRQQGR